MWIHPCVTITSSFYVCYNLLSRAKNVIHQKDTIIFFALVMCVLTTLREKFIFINIFII